MTDISSNGLKQAQINEEKPMKRLEPVEANWWDMFSLTPSGASTMVTTLGSVAVMIVSLTF